jgi:NADPH2:quinone reductase
MKAVLSRDPGGPETLKLEEVADPVPAKGELLIAIRACGVNVSRRADDPGPVSDEAAAAVFAGHRDRRRRRRSWVEGVTAFKVRRQASSGSIGHGGMAEKVAARGGSAVTCSRRACRSRTPAAFSSMYNTSYMALKSIAPHIKPGERLLVLGAAGGVGHRRGRTRQGVSGAHVMAAASSAGEGRRREGGVARTRPCVYPRGPFDRNGQKALAELFKSGFRRGRFRRGLRSGRRRLCGGGAALDGTGRALSWWLASPRASRKSRSICLC